MNWDILNILRAQNRLQMGGSTRSRSSLWFSQIDCGTFFLEKEGKNCDTYFLRRKEKNKPSTKNRLQIKLERCCCRGSFYLFIFFTFEEQEEEGFDGSSVCLFPSCQVKLIHLIRTSSSLETVKKHFKIQEEKESERAIVLLQLTYDTCRNIW